MLSLIPNIHREGWLFVAIFAIVALILGMISDALGWIGLVLTCWCAYFFRDPDRIVPNREGLVVSPADGVVQRICEAVPPDEMGMKKGKYNRISIFLNVFDVHVNRTPIGGKITKSYYIPGKFLNASLDKASEENERQCLVVETNNNVEVGFVQIAGLIARRIRCDVSVGQTLETGERFGLIRFGSRMDIYLPQKVTVLVAEGQRMISGETVLADFQSEEDNRGGVKR